MLYQVDTGLLASLVRAKRATQTLREAAAEITRTIGPVSVGTLLRVEQQYVPDLPVFLHLCNWLDVSPARLLYCASAPVPAPAETTAATVALVKSLVPKLNGWVAGGSFTVGVDNHVAVA